MQSYSIASALLLVCTLSAFAGARTEVLSADAAYRAALLNADAAKLANIMADEILIVHSDGGKDTKANFIDAIATGRLKLLSNERSDVEVRLYPPLALLFSRTRKKFTYKGGPGANYDTSIVTYMNQGGTWRIVAMQNTPSE